MTLLSMQQIGKEKVYTKFRRKGVEYSSDVCEWDYDFKDSVSEENRRRNNREAFKMILWELKRMKMKAKEDVKEAKSKERLIIDNIKRCDIMLKQYGSFKIGELQKYMEKFHKKIFKIYGIY